MDIKPVHLASCHCGAVQLELKLPDGLVNPRRCNCSLCRRKGAVMATVPKENLAILKGKDALSLYQFGTMTAKHYFCSRCGIYTHNQRFVNPDEYGINIACLEGVDPFELGELPVFDGRSLNADG